MSVEPLTRENIWNALLDASRSVKYFEARSKHFRKWKIAKGLLAALLGALVFTFPLLEGKFDDVAIAITLGSLFLVTALVDLRGTDDAAVLPALTNDLAVIESKLRLLFEHADTNYVSEETAQYAHTLLVDIMHHIGNRTDVSLDKKLRDRTEKEAYSAEENRYVGTQTR